MTLRAILPLLLGSSCHPAAPAQLEPIVDPSARAAATLGLEPYEPVPLPAWLDGPRVVWMKPTSGFCTPLVPDNGTSADDPEFFHATRCHAEVAEGVHVTATTGILELQGGGASHADGVVLESTPSLSVWLETGEDLFLHPRYRDPEPQALELFRDPWAGAGSERPGLIELPEFDCEGDEWVRGELGPLTTAQTLREHQ